MYLYCDCLYVNLKLHMTCCISRRSMGGHLIEALPAREVVIDEWINYAGVRGHCDKQEEQQVTFSTLLR